MRSPCALYAPPVRRYAPIVRLYAPTHSYAPGEVLEQGAWGGMEGERGPAHKLCSARNAVRRTSEDTSMA